MGPYIYTTKTLNQELVFPFDFVLLVAFLTPRVREPCPDYFDKFISSTKIFSRIYNNNFLVSEKIFAQ